MSAPHGCTDSKDVVAIFKDALNERIGADRFRMWFTHSVTFGIRDSHNSSEATAASQTQQFVVYVDGQFALDRLRAKFIQALRASAASASQRSGINLSTDVLIELSRPDASQAELPLDVVEQPKRTSARKNRAKQNRSRGKTRSLGALVDQGKATGSLSNERKTKTFDGQPTLPNLIEEKTDEVHRTPKEGHACWSGAPSETSANAKTQLDSMTFASYIAGESNQLAYTAVTMVCQGVMTATPLFLYGPSGSGKTHLVNAIAHQYRSRHRMRRVMKTNGERFTNDFCNSVSTSGLAAFRKRYRDVDALLVDDVQFLSGKDSTLREMLYTVEALIEGGRPIIFTANKSPTEIDGLTQELAGRMTSGLVCPMHSLDQETRQTLLRRWIDERCSLPWPNETLNELSDQLAGDGRILGGLVNLVATLQKMLSRMPTMDEIHTFGGELLRTNQSVVTLSTIERAVREVFQLGDSDLTSSSQARAVCEPRMLAMYLSRQLTRNAYSEIANHFGGRAHSTAIAADRNVKKWLKEQKTIGRGPSAISAREALDRLKTMLRAG